MTTEAEATIHTCPHPGCSYTAKAKGSISQHVKKKHGDDPLAAVRAGIPGAPTPGGAFRIDRPLEAAPSGVPSVDYAIGIGGVPKGTIIEVFGPSASGKTFMALTFSAYAQAQGERAGYMDAERALQPTFANLVRGLDLDALEYGVPPGEFGRTPEPFDGTGEAALEASRKFIDSGQFAIWTIDSVAACVPREELKRAIGDSQASASLARLMRQGLRSLTPAAERSGCVVVFVNHVTAVPQAKFGRDWSKPANEAFNYFASVQLHVTKGPGYYNKEKRQIGHEVRVKVHKSKVAAPFARASFDLFYAEDRVVPYSKDQKIEERDVVPGIDVASSYLSVLQESQQITNTSHGFVDLATGEKLGTGEELKLQLSDESSELFKRAYETVYPAQYRKKAA